MMTFLKLLITTILLQTNVLTSGLDLSELHGDLFPHRTLKQDMKRQYVFGRVLPSSHSQNMIGHDQDDDKQFQMNSMFSSAMGSKLKRLVSHIDSKMKVNEDDQQAEHGDAKKDVRNDNMMMSGNENPVFESRGNPLAERKRDSAVTGHQMVSGLGDSKAFTNYYHPLRRRLADDKRFSELDQRFSSLPDEDDTNRSDNFDDNDLQPVWLNRGQRPINLASRIPSDVRRRRLSANRKRKLEHLADNDDESWFDAPQNDKKAVKKDGNNHNHQMMHKKDSEIADDLTFFNDDNEVITELKRIFVDDDKDLPSYENSEEEAKDEGKGKVDASEDRTDDNDSESMEDARHKELIDEYIRHMAQAMSVKKRNYLPLRQREEIYEYREAEEMDNRLRHVFTFSFSLYFFLY